MVKFYSNEISPDWEVPLMEIVPFSVMMCPSSSSSLILPLLMLALPIEASTSNRRSSALLANSMSLLPKSTATVRLLVTSTCLPLISPELACTTTLPFVSFSDTFPNCDITEDCQSDHRCLLRRIECSVQDSLRADQFQRSRN